MAKPRTPKREPIRVGKAVVLWIVTIGAGHLVGRSQPVLDQPAATQFQASVQRDQEAHRIGDPTRARRAAAITPRTFATARSEDGVPHEGPRAHDPSTIVQCGNEFWVFATGTGVLSFRSTNLLSWASGPRVMPRLPAWIDRVVPGHRGHLWAPDIIHVGGRYRLYYSVSAWGKNSSAIALASNRTLDPAQPDYAWRDDGIVVRSYATSDFNAIDPSAMLDREGRLWLAFGSFWSGLKLVELDPATGLRLESDPPIIALAHAPEIEAPALMSRGDWYYLFINCGLCCRGVKSTYEIRVGRSREVTGPYVDQTGRDLRDGGGTLFLRTEGRFIGPGHAAVLGKETDWRLSYHFYDGERAGAPTLGIRRLEWSEDGWPIPGTQILPGERATESTVMSRWRRWSLRTRAFP